MGLRPACTRFPISGVNRRVQRMPNVKLIFKIARLFPRTAVHGLLVWALWCTVRYAPQVGISLIEYFCIIVSTISAVLASWAYFNVWFYGPGSPLEFEELATSCVDSNTNTDMNTSKTTNINGNKQPKFSDSYTMQSVPYPDQTRSSSHYASPPPGPTKQSTNFLASTESQNTTSSTESGLPAVMRNTVEAKYDGTARYCQKCQCYKPDRTHHCRHCGYCILRMDHHCPWFACCIGFRNHRFFVQFLGYGLALALTSTLLSILCLVQFVRYEMYLEFVLSVNFVFFLVMSIVFSLILIAFGPYTFYQVLINRTTLEGMEPSAYRTQVAAAHWRFRRPPDYETLGNMYDLGTKQNIREIMGSSWIQWLLPIRVSLPSNGTSFRANEELRQRACDRANVELEMRRRRAQYYQESQQIV